MKTMGILWMVLSMLVLPALGNAGEAGRDGAATVSPIANKVIVAKNNSVNPFPETSKPGLYVDNRAGFAFSYPREWTSTKPRGREIFRAEPEGRYPSIRVWFFPNFTMPLKNLSRVWTTSLKNYSKGEIKPLYDQQTSSSSGMEAREVELQWVTNEKTPRPDLKINSYYFAVKKDNGWIVIGIYSVNGLVPEDLKKTVYSIQIKPREDTG